MDKLVDDFEKSLFNSSENVISDYLEIGIDSLMNEGILKELPIVNTIVGVLKVGKNVHDRNLLKQTLTFINEFNNNQISDDKLERYKLTIEMNPKRCLSYITQKKGDLEEEEEKVLKENKKVIKSGRYTIGDKWWFYNGNFYYDNDIVGAFSYNK